MDSNSATLAVPTAQQEAVLNAFGAKIPPIQVSPVYKLGLVVVALAMVLLPLIYLGLIAGVGYLLVYHLENNATVFRDMSGRAALFVFVVPLVVGCTLVFFMIKPLFARPEKEDDPFVLDPGSERFLFRFVAHLCRAVGAPEPKEIRVDSDVNASAGFRRGIWSMFGNDLVLNIGLPLVAGMTLRQFAGVLAHEFGHFAQGAGMRLTYIIRTVNAWFARVVYERDEWDQTLTEWSKDSDFRIMIVLMIARFFIWVTRRILWVLMMVGHGISCFMLRQMEFDADHYETCLSGSDTFEESMRLVTTLSAAHHFALEHLSASWDEGRLADNLPALVALNLKTLPAEVKQKIEVHISESKTEFMATHPADRDRIQHAKALNMSGIFAPPGTHPTDTDRILQAQALKADGVFKPDSSPNENNAEAPLPASVLFSKFPTLCKAASLKFYRASLGRQVKAESLFPVEELMERKEAEEAGQKALARYFQGGFSSIRSFEFPEHPPEPEGEIVEAPGKVLGTLRAAFLGGLPAYMTHYKKYDEADSRVIEMNQAMALIHAKLPIDSKSFKLSSATHASATAQRKLAQEQQDGLDPEMSPYEEVLKKRILAALTILFSKASRGDNGKEADEVRRMWPALFALQSNLGTLIQLRNRHLAMMVLLENLAGHEEDGDLIRTIQSEMGRVRKIVNEVYEQLGLVEYPFDHAKGRVALRDFAIGRRPAVGDLGKIVEASGGALSKLYDLYARIMGRLVLIAEKVEAAEGLPSLPEVKPKEDGAQQENA